jgi:rieske iron-sulfur protein
MVEDEEKQRPAPSAQVPPSVPRPIPPAPRPGTVVAPPPPQGAPRPPAAPPVPAKQGRRKFLTLITIVGGLLALAPYVPFGRFLSASIQGSTNITKAQRIVLDNNATVNGKAAGKPVAVGDLANFPPNSGWVMTYPSSGDPTIDAQNPNTFVKFQLIRLPTELEGDKPVAASFVAFSKVCVHLWCSPNYNPQQCTSSGENGYTSAPGCETHELYECPCHGSAYRVPDGLCIEGPAAIQPPPTNAIPILTLSADSSGFLQVEPAVWDTTHNGVLGYGRYIQGVTTTDAYKQFIKTG